MKPALTPLNVTVVAAVKFVPLIDTLVPTGPLVGVKLVIVGGLGIGAGVVALAVVEYGLRLPAASVARTR